MVETAALLNWNNYKTGSFGVFPLFRAGLARYTDGMRARRFWNTSKRSLTMPAPLNARLRRLWLNIHLWIGLGLAVLLVPISLSGALLVWHDHLDALINPARYAVTDGQALPPIGTAGERRARRSAQRLRADGGAHAGERRLAGDRHGARSSARGERRRTSAPAHGLSRSADRARARRGRISQLADRLPASLPREPDDPGIQRPRHRRLGRRCACW